jgi:hypothetical protein
VVDWPELAQGQEAEEDESGLRTGVESLLLEAGLTGHFRALPLDGGANNRVFHLQGTGSDFLLKMYSESPGDSRARPSTEFNFCRFAWDQNVRALPRPLAWTPETRVALYEYIPGRLLRPDEIGVDVVSEALDFYEAINKNSQLPAARALPPASEACFSIGDHLERVAWRVARLADLEVSSEVDDRARTFIGQALVPAWKEIRQRTEAGAGTGYLQARIPESDERLSPSDFGFHNAIRTADGSLRFIDFEYAGWDDPARMVCDFFCQPALPIPSDYFDWVARRVTADLSEPETHLRNTRLLFSVYQIKWCCILLNDFLKSGHDRRNFSTRGSAETRKVAQLEKARLKLDTLLGTTKSQLPASGGDEKHGLH